MSEPQPVVDKLVESHREFLAFLQRRVGDRALAEDILQEAFVRGIDRGDEVRDPEAARAWFYRLLRNAVIDQSRRRGTADKALAALAKELEDATAAPPDLDDTVCKCVRSLASTLKPEYAEALEQVDVDGVAVRDYAERTGITPNNASVRLFRAREALRKRVTQSCGTCAEHGCLDCTCSS